MEIEFAKTVGADCKIHDMMRRNGDEEHIFTDDTPYFERAQRMAEVMHCMNEGYIAKKRFEALQSGREPEETEPLSKEDFLLLETEEFNDLFTKAWSIFNKDERTVRTKTGSGKDAKKKE